MESDISLGPGHLCNMGRMIEEMESKLRNGLDQVLDVKSCVTSSLRDTFDKLVALYLLTNIY